LVTLPPGPLALDAREVDAVRLCGAASHGGGLRSVSFDRGGGFVRFLRWRWRPGAVAARRLALGHLRHRLADVDRLIGPNEDLGDRAAGGRGHLGIDLVGGYLDDGVALGDLVALGDVPFEHGALSHRLAHLGHHDLEAAALQLLAGGDRGVVGSGLPVGLGTGAVGFGSGLLGGFATLLCLHCRRFLSSLRGAAVRVDLGHRLADLDLLVGLHRIFVTVPPAGAGTSASTLSVETSTIVWPLLDRIPLRDMPLEHGAFSHRLAHLGHQQLNLLLSRHSPC